MKRLLLAAALLAVPFAASAQMSPGTVKLLSGNATLVEAASGDAFVEVKDDKSAKFLIIGPETLQADIRLNLGASETQGAPVVLVILAGGKEVARYKVTPKAGADKWKGRVDVKPSTMIGFFMAIDAGPHAYEVKTIGATRGAAIHLVPKAKAKRALAANASTVPSKPPVVATPTPAPTPGIVATATTAPIATPVNTPVAMETLEGKGPKASELKRERRTYETAFKAGFAMPRSSDFAGSAAIGAEARWAINKGRTIAVSLEVLQHGYSAIVPDDPDRSEPPTAVDMSLLPVSVGATYLVPLESMIQPYAGVAATIGYGQSTFRQQNRETIPEALVGFGGQAALGVQYDLSGTDLAEGSRKVFLEAKGSYLTIPFEAHDYTDWSTVQVLGGISLKF